MPRPRGEGERSTVKRLFATVAAALAAITLVSLANVPSASAHERRQVAGKYTFVVGFLNEPVFLEEPNGVSLTVTNMQTNEPVEGVEKTLKADITAGGQTKTVELKARFGQKGAYSADVIPTKGGPWTFRFYGTIDGTQIEEKFESGPGRFNEPQSKAELLFPVKLPSIGELAEQVQRGGAPAEPSAGGSAVDVQRALDKAEDAQSTATTFGIIGILVGLAGVALAAWALITRRGGASSTARQEPV